MTGNWEAVIRYCRNCGGRVTGYKNDKGLVKASCPRCRAVTVSKMIDRRHERCDTYAPSDYD